LFSVPTDSYLSSVIAGVETPAENIVNLDFAPHYENLFFIPVTIVFFVILDKLFPDRSTLTKLAVSAVPVGVGFARSHGRGRLRRWPTARP
jgi:hypothetical protein